MANTHGVLNVKFRYLCNHAGGGRLIKGLEYAVPYRNPEF